MRSPFLPKQLLQQRTFRSSVVATYSESYQTYHHTTINYHHHAWCQWCTETSLKLLSENKAQRHFWRDRCLFVNGRLQKVNMYKIFYPSPCTVITTTTTAVYTRKICIIVHKNVLSFSMIIYFSAAAKYQMIKVATQRYSKEEDASIKQKTWNTVQKIAHK